MNIIVGTAIAGVLTVGAGVIYQKASDKMNYHPSTLMSLFIIGCTAKLLGLTTSLILPGPSALAGLGESLPELDSKIDMYQKHITQLQKVAIAGSPDGKAAAKKKLAQETQSLQTLLNRREDLVSD